METTAPQQLVNSAFHSIVITSVFKRDIVTDNFSFIFINNRIWTITISYHQRTIYFCLLHSNCLTKQSYFIKNDEFLELKSMSGVIYTSFLKIRRTACFLLLCCTSVYERICVRYFWHFLSVHLYLFEFCTCRSSLRITQPLPINDGDTSSSAAWQKWLVSHDVCIYQSNN